MVLLQKFWKLSLILVLLESYSDWTIMNKESFLKNINNTISLSVQSEVHLEDLRFYKGVLTVLIHTSCFTFYIHILTRMYTLYNQQPGIPFILLMKAITLSKCSIFLTLPTLIWDINVYEVHSHFIYIYSTLSQLLAYRGNFIFINTKHIDYILFFQLYLILVNYGVF